MTDPLGENRINPAKKQDKCLTLHNQNMKNIDRDKRNIFVLNKGKKVK